MVEPAAQRIWEAALGQLQIHVTKPNYETWLKDTVGLHFADGRFVVGAPTEFVKEWLSTRMRSLVSQTVGGIVGQPTEVSFQIIAHENGGTGNGATASPAQTAKPTSYPHPNPKLTFTSFIVGPSNHLAASAALAAAEQPGKGYNPLFIYSAPGLGKTHLLQAIAQHAASTNYNTLYVTSERFTNDFVTAITQSRSDEFRQRYRSLQLLLVDDVQFLAGKERTQEEFFYTFNELHAAGCQLVLANDRPPSDICGIESRLSSRFQWGLIADIQPPDLPTRLTILQRKAREQQVDLHPDVGLFLANRTRNNIRELEGSLNRVIAYARLPGVAPITLSITHQALAALTPAPDTSSDPDQILQAVASYFRISSKTLTSKLRTQAVANARHIAMYLLREDSQLPLKRIGLLLGHRDHATVIHGVQKITRAINNDPQLLTQIAEIRTSVRR